jgi:hypothetical protein
MINRILVKGFSKPLYVNKSVALIGNSPKLLECENGGGIDSFADVIRFNGALINNYSKHVGTKTTIQILAIDLLGMFSEPYVRPTDQSIEAKVLARKHNAKVFLDIFPVSKIITHSPFLFDEEKQGDQRFRTATYLCENQSELDIVYMNGWGEENAFSHFKTANEFLVVLGLEPCLNFGGPRTGFKTILKLVLAGIKPTLYGFDIDVTMKFSGHYHEKNHRSEIDEFKSHDIRGEMVAINQLAGNGFIEVVS